MIACIDLVSVASVCVCLQGASCRSVSVHFIRRPDGAALPDTRLIEKGRGRLNRRGDGDGVRPAAVWRRRRAF